MTLQSGRRHAARIWLATMVALWCAGCFHETSDPLVDTRGVASDADEGISMPMMLTFYNQGEFQFFENEYGAGDWESQGAQLDGDPAIFPQYIVITVTAVGGTAGTYTIWAQ